MLELFLTGNSIVIKTVSAYRETLLTQPLHKIFLRSTLGGLFNTEKDAWEIPLYKNDESQLEKLLSHLEKYKIQFTIDAKLKKIIDDITWKLIEYQNILKSGQSAKLSLPEEKKKELKLLLNKTFIRTPKDYQLKAVHHLLSVKNGANFSVPGSGKTTIALAYYSILKGTSIVDSIFIIGPVSSYEPWENEFKECFGRPVRNIRISGHTKKQRQHIYLLSSKYEMILTSYQSISHDTKEITHLLKKRRYLLILDESHYIKKPQGGKISESVLEISKYATRRVILTGTPMPNGFSDLWSQFTFLWPSHLPLGRVESYLISIQKNTVSITKDKIKKSISPLFFRITKKELNLPTPKFHIIHCDLSPLQKRIYMGISQKFLAELNEKTEDKSILRQYRKARVIRLLQVASNPGLLKQYCEEFLIPPLESNDISLSRIIDHYYKYEIPSKFNVINNIVENIIYNGKKILLWSSFIHNLISLGKVFSKYNPVVVFGGIPYQSEKDELNREQLINKFKNDPNCLLMIANPAACAESISLHNTCHDAIYLDRTFNCAHYLQSLDRIHRLGLKPNSQINYYLIIAKKSIDEVIHARLLSKIKTMKDIIEGELPGTIPGYWDDDLGDEESIDFELVENHIKELFNNENN